MDAFSLRLERDRERIQSLPARSAGQVRILSLPQSRNPSLGLELGYRTADSADYPKRSRSQTQIQIDFGARYPFVAPIARISTPILHPNVWESGVICLGSKWTASEGIDLFVHRIARLITFDPLLVNEQSAADRNALGWYQQARRRHPDAFPSDLVQWRDSALSTTILACACCGSRLRVPIGRRGLINCPRCHRDFEAQT